MPLLRIVRKGAQDSGFSRDWDALRADGDIQFSPVELPENPPPPDWLQRFFELLSEALAPVARLLVSAWPVLFWVLVGLGLALFAYLLFRLVEPDRISRRRGPGGNDLDWTPDQVQALALLEEADRLAAEGRFDEATHLLLQRSVGQIAQIRPDLIDPSITAREIAALPALPEAARAAFSVIAERVERSLFALRRLSAEDWRTSRDAYAEFALGYRGERA